MARWVPWTDYLVVSGQLTLVIYFHNIQRALCSPFLGARFPIVQALIGQDWSLNSRSGLVWCGVGQLLE